MAKVWVYAVMWNERELLPWWVRWYRQFAERIVVYDHASDDGCRELARELGCEVRDFPGQPGVIFEPALTATKNSCWKEARGEADFVVVVDLDEFVTAVGRDMRTMLEDLRRNECRWPGLEGFRGHGSREWFLRAWERRRRVE